MSQQTENAIDVMARKRKEMEAETKVLVKLFEKEEKRQIAEKKAKGMYVIEPIAPQIIK